MEKDIHVVFGEISYNILKLSGLLSSDDAEIIIFSSALNEGPVCGLQSSELELQARVDWFSSITREKFTNSYDDQHHCEREDLAKLSNILECAKTDCQIYLWTGCNAAEFAGTARLFHYIANYTNNFSIATFPHLSSTKVNGKTVCTNYLAITRQEEVPYIYNNFKKLTEQDFQIWKERGRKLMDGSGTLRVIGEDGSLDEVLENHFDQILLSNCTAVFQKPALIVANTLWQTDFAVGDIFLHWRLTEMAKSNQIEYRGKLKTMRDYEVKLPMNHS